MSKLKEKLALLEHSSATGADFVFLNLSESLILSLNGGAKTNNRCPNRSCSGSNGDAADDNNNSCANDKCSTTGMNNDGCTNGSCG